jgi:outer membrane protein OmpA-like peptidoglycan-associated protein
MKRITLILCSVLIGTCAAGQSSSQLSAFGTFGVMSGLMYTPAEGINKIQFGYGGGLNYTYFFKPAFGISVGAEVGTYSNKFELSDFRGDDPAHDGEESFRLRYELSGYSETQNIMSLHVPVMLNFEIGRKVKFVTNVGAKLNILLNATYTSTLANITTAGYYPQYELTLPELIGFGEFNNVKGSGKLLLRSVSPIFTAEVGIKVMLSREWALYMGGYIDYGLRLYEKPDQTQAFIKYNAVNNSDYKINSILQSQRGGDKVFVEKLALFSAGAKLRIAFNAAVVMPQKDEPKSLDLFASLKSEPKPAPVPAPTPLTNEVPPAEIKEQAKKGEEDNIPRIIKKRVTFTLKSARLTDAQKADLDDKARVLEKNPDLKISVRGYANDYLDKKPIKDPKLKKAAETKNKKLSAQRAKAIKDYLVAKGISGSRIKTVSRGSKNPLVPNTTPRNRSKNRRADFVILKK